MEGWVAPGSEHGVVSPVRVDPSGQRGPTKRQAAGPDWRRSSSGLFVPAHVPQTAEQRIVEAGFPVPMYSALTGWAALRWHGATWFTGTDADGDFLDVPIAAPRHRIRNQDGILVCGERFNPQEAQNVDGIWVASAQMSLCFAMRYAVTAREATVALDMAAFDDLVSIDEAWDYALAHPSYTGIPQCREAIPPADENSWSPMEVRMRRAWVAAGFPPPLMNRPLFDLEGHHIGTPDLLDPRSGVIGQYDGGLHLAGAQRRRDVHRDEVYRDHDLESVISMAADLRSPVFGTRLRAAYARADAKPASARTWTLERPPWWVPTFTVAQRRALDAVQRERWLRRRAA